MYMRPHEPFVFPSGSTQHEQQVLFHRPIGQQLIVLEDDAQTATQVRQFAPTDLRQVIVQYPRLAFGEQRRHVLRLRHLDGERRKRRARSRQRDDNRKPAHPVFSLYLAHYDEERKIPNLHRSCRQKIPHVLTSGCSQ